MSLRNCVDNFTRIQTSGTFPSTISKCKWLVLMLHKNEIWLTEKVQSFRDFTEYYFTSRLNKTPESRLKVRSQFFFFNLLFYVRSMCCLVYLLSKHLSAQTLPNVRTQFRRVFMKVRFKRWHVDRGSLRTSLFIKQCFKIWAVKESQENDRPYCDRGI